GGAGGGAGGTIKLYATDVNAGGAIIDVQGGLGGVRFEGGRAGSGEGGRFIIASNTQAVEPQAGNLAGIALTGIERYAGPTGLNPYILGAPQTANLPGIAGGAEVFGIVAGLSARSLDYDLSDADIDGPQANALVGILRYDLALATDNPFREVFPGYDLILFANVSGLAIVSPVIGFGIAAQALMTGGLQADTALTSLPDDAVWAVLVREDDALFNGSTVTNGLYASIATEIAGSVSMLSGVSIADNGVRYIAAQRAAAPQVADIQGFDAVALRPAAAGAAPSHAYGLASGQDALVVINLADGSQRQLFKDGQADAMNGRVIDGLDGASALAVSGDAAGGFVLVASQSEQKIAVFERVGANLRFLGATQVAGQFHDALRIEGTTVFASGAGGTIRLTLDASGALGAATLVTAAPGTEIVTHGNLAFIADAAGDALRVVDLASGAVVQSFAGFGLGLAGAADLAYHQDANGGFLFVTGGASDTLAVFRATGRPGDPLEHVQTLRNGQDGVRGLAAPSDIAVTPDGRYVLVTGGAGNTLAVFVRERQDGTLLPALQFAQVLREDVAGIRGLETPAALALGQYDPVANTLEVFVGSLGMPVEIGGFARFVADLSPQAPPSRFVTEHHHVEAIGLVTGDGDDRVQIALAPPAIVESTLVRTNGGADGVVVADFGASTRIELGAGDDTAELRAQSADRALTLFGGRGDDRITIVSTGARAVTEIYGDDDRTSPGGGADIITIERVGPGAVTRVFAGSGDDEVIVFAENLPADAMTIAHGDDPTGGATGDRLRFVVPPAATISAFDASGSPVPGPLLPDGALELPGRGRLVYTSFEGYAIAAAPVIRFIDPATGLEQTQLSAIEGQDLTIRVEVIPFGDGSVAPPGVVFDIDGDGLFGDVTGIRQGPASNFYDVTLSWARLVELGLRESRFSPFAIAARATNNVPLTGSAAARVALADRRPAVTATVPPVGYVGQPFEIRDFLAIDASAVDRAVNWVIDWDGDGTVDEIFGSTSAAATRVFAQPGRFTLRVGVIDDDPATRDAAGDPVPTWSAAYAYEIHVRQQDLSPGGPYAIREGGRVTLTATAPGAPTEYLWTIGTGPSAVTISSGAAPVLDFAWGQNGVVDSGTYAVSLQVRYSALLQQGGATALTVSNVAPSFLAFIGSTVDEGAASASVAFAGTGDPAAPDQDRLRYRIDVFDSASASWIEILNQIVTPHSGGFTGTIPAQWLRESGSLTVRGQIIDKDGGVAEGLTTIRINEVPPVLVGVTRDAQPEGALSTLAITVRDPGADVIRDWIVDWGDGTRETFPGGTRTLAPNGETITAARFTHRYLDNGTYQARIWAVDGSGQYDFGAHELVVDNVAPVITASAVAGAGGALPVFENGFAIVSGRFADPGTLDVHRMVVTWEVEHAPGLWSVFAVDPDASGLTFVTGTRDFSLARQFAQDGNYRVTVAIADDDGGATQVTHGFAVLNLPPAITALNVAPSPAEEGSAVVLTGTFTDPGPLDTHAIVIDWGDGTLSRSAGIGADIVVDPVNRSFMVRHVYADNRPGNAPYMIGVTVTDERGDSDRETVDVSVLNAPPVFRAIALTDLADGIRRPAIWRDVSGGISGALPPVTLTLLENGRLRLEGAFSDAGGAADAPYTLEISFGEKAVGGVTRPHRLTLTTAPGGGITYDAQAGLYRFSAEHSYLDDDPTATSGDDYQIRLRVTDKDGASTEALAQIRVANAAPVLTATITRQGLVPGERTFVEGFFTETGTLDTHVVTIDWGDGTVERIAVDPVTRGFRVDHAYRALGGFQIRLAVADDDTDIALVTFAIQVTPPIEADPERLAPELLPVMTSTGPGAAGFFAPDYGAPSELILGGGKVPPKTASVDPDAYSDEGAPYLVPYDPLGRAPDAPGSAVAAAGTDAEDRVRRALPSAGGMSGA
ncbi:MAG: beta-propeller fold lactonase family protein, partial [Hyphomicrobiales bacterium]|nr:beta-propeller fold lactonase family protein [Hyphomicrobiales bacterium]